MFPADFYVDNISSALPLTPNTLWSIKGSPQLDTRHWARWTTWDQCSYTIEIILYFRWLFADSGLYWPLGLLSGGILLTILTGSGLLHLSLQYRHGSVTRIIRTRLHRLNYLLFLKLGLCVSTACDTEQLQIILESRRVLVTKASATQNNLRTSSTEQIK